MGSNSHLVSLKWRQHQMNFCGAFSHLLDSQDFVDVTLVAGENVTVGAHKAVLSATSPYLRKLLLSNPCQHPIIIFQDIDATVLGWLIKFMYGGEIDIPSSKLPQLLRAARLLKVRGISEALQKSTTNNVGMAGGLANKGKCEAGKLVGTPVPAASISLEVVGPQKAGNSIAPSVANSSTTNASLPRRSMISKARSVPFSSMDHQGVLVLNRNSAGISPASGASLTKPQGENAGSSFLKPATHSSQADTSSAMKTDSPKSRSEELDDLPPPSSQIDNIDVDLNLGDAQSAEPEIPNSNQWSQQQSILAGYLLSKDTSPTSDRQPVRPRKQLEHSVVKGEASHGIEQSAKCRTRIKCNLCHRTLASQRLLGIHLKTHDPFRKTHLCRLCHRVYHRSYELARHHRVKHPGEPFTLSSDS